MALRADVPRCRFAVLAWAAVSDARESGQPELAGGHIFFPHRRRAVPQPDRPQQHHEALAAALRRSDDGHLVHGRALGNLVAGRVAGLIESLPLPQLFGAVTLFSVGAGQVLLVFTKPLKKWIGDAK